ncbi:monooxygenase [filamentous cyanobacterium CCT1]|nr:monooxygenase [filamentous cyanobacterium CCT1]PSN78702.1 monooxygenase [filamentous cyanobacterium CCP4]
MSSGTSPSRAVVVGGSIAGLLAARVLSENFDQVVIVERDHLPPTSVPRRGVPQSVQPHVLFVRGYRMLQELFPGIEKDLELAGAVPIDWGKEFHYFHQGGFNATFDGDSGLVSVTCTRPLLETTIRHHVDRLPNVKWLEGSRVCGLLGGPDQVSGICYRSGRQGDEQQLSAALVVDASGRSTRAPEWLDAIGAPVPVATVVNPFVGYATQRLRIPEAWKADWKVLLISQEAPDNCRLGYMAQVEGGEWIATLGGYSKDYPPLDPDGFLDFAHSLAHPAFYEALKAAEPVSDIKAHRATANRLFHYEKLQVPHGFAAIGDSVCALCPVYGQGMTVSAVSAMELRDWLQEQPGSYQPLETFRFQQRLAKVLQFPWAAATGSDVQFPLTEGIVPSNPIAGLFQGYMERIIQKSKQEGWIHIRFTEVAHMVKPPTAFFEPRLVLKALSRG